MKTIRRSKVLLFALVSLLVLSLGLATIFAGTFKSTMAETTEVGSVAFVDGAEIRAKADVNDTGIRFTAKIDSELAGALFTTNQETGIANGFKDDCSLGMIIVPKQALDAVEEGEDYFTVLKEKFGREKDSIAVDFSFEQNNIWANYDQGALDASYPYSVKGAIVGFNNANLKYEYAAVVYYSTDGGESFVYSQRSCEVNFADKANEVLSSGVEIDEDVKNSIVSYVAKTVLMQKVGDVSGYDLQENVATITADVLVEAGEAKGVDTFFEYDYDTVLPTNLDGVSYDQNALNATGFGKATLEAEAYDGALVYAYNVYFYPKTEVDLTGNFGDAYASATSITIADREFALDAGKAAFPLQGEEDARALASDREQAVSVEIGGKTYKANITLWSLLIDSTNIDTMQNYEYKTNNEGTYGFFKLAEDVAVTHFSTATQLGRDCIKLGGDASTKDNTEALTRGFKGVFEGNNKTLSYSAPTGSETRPLFFNLAVGSIVKNLNVVKTAGKYCQPLISKYGSGFTLDNVYIDVRADGGSFGEREGSAVAVLYGPKDVIFKNFTFDYWACTAWSYGSSPLIAKGTESAAHAVTSRFGGKVILDNVNINFANDRFFYDDAAKYPSNIYNKLFNGLVYSNVVKTGETSYTADWAPVITAVEGLDTLTVNIAGKAKKYEISKVTLAAEQGETVSLINVVPGATLRMSYDINVSEKSTTITGATVTGNATTYTRRDSGSVTMDAPGVYNYLVVTTAYEMVYVTVNVVAPAEVTIETEVIADLKDGISVAKLLAVANLPNDETVTTAKFGGASYSVADGGVYFGDVSDMTDAIKMLPREDAYELTLIGAENKYTFTNFKLYSILVSNADEYDTVASFQTAEGYTANGGKEYWAVIGFDADVKLNPIKTTSSLGPSSSSTGHAFRGVIDGRNHKITGFDAATNNMMGFSKTAWNAKLKNIDLTMAKNNCNGIFGRWCKGLIFENVIITTTISTTGGNSGLLLFDFMGSSNFVFKNVTVINTYDNPAYANPGRQWLGSPYATDNSYRFTGKIVVDNVNFVQLGASYKLKIFAGLNFTYGLNCSSGFGDAIVLAEGATKGITIYDTKADYLAGTNGHEMTSKVIADPINATANSALTVTGLVDEGKTFLYATTYISGNGSATTVYGSTTSVTYKAAGTYKLLVVDTDYVNYIYTVVVA